MTEHPLSRALTQAVEHTQALCTLAQSGEWEAFEQRLPQRNAQLAQLDRAVADCDSLNSEQQARVAEQLQSLKSLNQTLLTLAQARQEQVALESRQSKQHRQAAAAYRGGQTR